jgi:hypothetical protein
MNGHWDVTERQGVSRAFVRARKRCLKDYLVYRQCKAILGDKPDVPESYEMQLYYQKLMKVMKEGIYRGRILQSYVLFWVIMFIFEILYR